MELLRLSLPLLALIAVVSSCGCCRLVSLLLVHLVAAYWASSMPPATQMRFSPPPLGSRDVVAADIELGQCPHVGDDLSKGDNAYILTCML
jgi:hypothetical protein